MNLKRIFPIAGVALTVSCGGGPTIDPKPVIDDPIVSCPSDVSVTSHSGSNPTVVFDVPAAAKGAPPVTVRCTPASGAQFKNGVTTVTCEAADSRAHKATCSFSVTVTSIPLLLKTKFMAFGDSITEGKTRLQAPAILQVPSNIFNANGSYPEALNAKLTARYQDQAITLVAYGWGGEKAGEGKIRLRDHWGEFNPDAVMLLEGTNDLLAPDTATQAGMAAAIESVVDALRVDIVFAKQRGARVFLGTLLPMTQPQPPNVVAAVPMLNTRIRGLALEQSVRLVDLNAAVPIAMIGRDGTHPGPGSPVYDLMADEWLKAIIATMEVSPSTPQ